MAQMLLYMSVFAVCIGVVIRVTVAVRTGVVIRVSVVLPTSPRQDERPGVLPQ